MTIDYGDDLKNKAAALLKSIESGDPDAGAAINADAYRQHNLGVADGVEGFAEALSALPEGSVRVDIARVFRDGDFVFAHTDYDFFGPKIGFDVFRFVDGLIVEHWDNLQETATDPNPSGRTMIDGPTEVTDRDKTEDNKAFVRGFVESVLMAGDTSNLAELINPDLYHQHNPQIADGLDGLGAALAAFAERGIVMAYDKIHGVFGEGDFVLTVSEGSLGGVASSFYDLFRVEDGLIVEHWDVIEPIAPPAEHAHSNGKFGDMAALSGS